MRSLVSAVLLTAATSRAELWCTGYYPGWEQASVPPSALDFKTLTHVIHFAVVPNADGTLNSSVNLLTPANSSNLVNHAHGAGRKALICVGGNRSRGGFLGATATTNRSAFVTDVVQFMSRRGYDGVDIDWEPIEASDAGQYADFIRELRAALDVITPRPLLTVAVASPPTAPALIASLQDQFDQINLMTYDLSGPFAGWVTWFNSPLHDGGGRFPGTGEPLPSAAAMVLRMKQAGIATRKLGLGLAFYGWVWSGGTGTSTGGAALPRQSWVTPPEVAQLGYQQILTAHSQTNLHLWDSNAHAAYISIDRPGSRDDKFISFDDARACQSKVAYAREQQLGGVFIWQLAQDQFAGGKGTLLPAVSKALATPDNPKAGDDSPPDVRR